MPIREFECDQCEEIFEELILRAVDEEDVTCPRCGGRQVQRLMSRSAIGRGGGTSPSAPAPSCGPFR